MAEFGPFGTALLVFLVLAVATVALFLGLRMLKSGKLQRALRTREEEAARADQAHNVLVTSEGIARELRARGFESTQANALLEAARRAYFEGHRAEGEDLAVQARSVLLELLRRDEGTTSPSEEIGEPPEEKPVLGKEYPKNYLQAKFLLRMVQGRLKDLKKGAKEGKEARRLAKEAQTAFDEERYTEALALALGSRRILDGREAAPAGVGEASAGRGEEGRCPSCDARMSPEDDFCGKCGASLQVTTTCPACEAPVEDGDSFCRKCGAVLTAAPEAR